MQFTKIAAVVTCFYPKKEELVPLLISVVKQVDTVYLINNGGLDAHSDPIYKNGKVETINAPTNLGTAGAYNLGARISWDAGHSHVLLLDQDSECEPEMVNSLVKLETFLKSKNQRVAVVGPYYICKSNGKPAPFIRHVGYRIERIHEIHSGLPVTDSNEKYVECSYVISSGSLISRESWKEIGNTQDGLFLDFTDIEWGLRANAKGFKCFGSFSAKMFHMIGDEQAQIFGRKISLHSPLRHYYAFRNCVWLHKQSYIPLGTRTNYLVKLLPKLVIYAWFSNQPIEQIRYMFKGISDGFWGRMGALQK